MNPLNQFENFNKQNLGNFITLSINQLLRKFSKISLILASIYQINLHQI